MRRSTFASSARKEMRYRAVVSELRDFIDRRLPKQKNEEMPWHFPNRSSGKRACGHLHVSLNFEGA